MNTRYDLIGDIHGYADALESLLLHLGYQPCAKTFRHPEGRKVIFLGDYIDRGPKIRRTLEIVRAMVESGDALALMGNHEFNALAYHTPDGKGGFLRKHTPEKIHQHSATVRQLVDPFPDEWLEWMDWFRRLPVFLELDGMRAVHAAWNEEAIALLRGIGPLDDALLREMAPKKNPLGSARNRLINGYELRLPDGFFFSDKAGFRRTEIRLRWWESLHGRTYRQMVFPDSDTVPDLLIPPDALNGHRAYPADAPPVFMGHYWLPADATPAPVASNVACLDYSVAKGGRLIAYRWNGEREIDAAAFCSFSNQNGSEP